MKESLVFQPQGTCSRRIDIRLDGDTIREVVFTGGCHGNTQGIAALVRGNGDFVSRPAGPGAEIDALTAGD